MAANAADKFQYVGEPGTATTLSAPGYTIGNASITVASTTNFPTLTGVTFAIDVAEVVNGEEVRVDGSYCVFAGVVTSGTAIGSLTLLAGTAQDYAAGALTRVYITTSSQWAERLIQGLTAEHDQLDGTHTDITPDSVTSAGAVQGASIVSTGDIQHRSISLETIRSHFVFDYVQSGCVWSGDSYGSTRAASMTAGVVYIGGKRVSVSAVTARTFTASRDTYVDIGDDGVVDYNEVTNNAASPALAASHIRVAIIITGAGNIANAGSVNQGQEDKVLPIVATVPYTTTDSLGNLICPRDSNRKLLGYRQIITNFATSATTVAQITGLTCPVIVPTGRKVKVSFFCYLVTASLADKYNIVELWDGVAGSGTKLNAVQNRTAQATTGHHMYTETLSTPATASKSYNAGAIAESAATTTLVASATTPVWIKVELA